MTKLKIRLILKSFSKNLLATVEDELKNFLKNLLINFTYIRLPNKKKRFCVLRSPHIDKDAREHFEIISYKGFFNFDITSKEHLNTLLLKEVPTGITYEIKIL